MCEQVFTFLINIFSKLIPRPLSSVAHHESLRKNGGAVSTGASDTVALALWRISFLVSVRQVNFPAVFTDEWALVA